jgi:hypothetical protein
MENKAQFDTQNAKIQGLIARYLELRSSDSIRTRTDHLDEDTLTAFAEGRLTKREAIPAVSHLTECGFCRHLTTELVRLELQMSEQDAPTTVTEAREPSKVSEVLSGILSRIFGAGDAAVFAHEEPKKKEEEDEPDKEA